jgi:SpoIID/LytB domain protein
MEAFHNVWGQPEVPYFKVAIDAPKEIADRKVALTSEVEVRKWIEETPKTFCSPHIIPENSLPRYLASVDEEGNYFRWQFTHSQAEITELLNQQLKLEAKAIERIEILKRGTSGRVIEMAIHYTQRNGRKSHIIEDQYEIRKHLHKKFLYSSAFVIDTIGGENNIPEAFVFKGAGWGHGAGYCQIGALGMSLQGYTKAEILSHYFPGTTLTKLYR